MKQLIVICAVAALAGCGVETATTAATGAAIKKQEVEQGKNTMQQAQQKIDQATLQTTGATMIAVTGLAGFALADDKSFADLFS